MPSAWCSIVALIAAALLLVPSVVCGDVQPHALISDGMVLQQKCDVQLWGTADKAEPVTVRFRGQEASTTADDEGRWLVRVASGEAGGPFPLRIAGKNTIALSNVFVGEVWVASGQSNMGWPVATRPGSAGLTGTENPAIRLFSVEQKLADTPQADVAGSWQACGPDSLLNFSAVAYYFGRQIQATQHVPVGLIHASYGGSGIRAWTGAKSLEEAPELAALRERDAQGAAAAARNQERLKPEIARYEAALAKAKKEGTRLPEPPRGMNAPPARYSRLYNGMIAPLLPFRIRGVIWYQGEADVGHAGDYEALLTVLIRSWREAWDEVEFPFLFVQVAPFRKIVDKPQESDWARLRESQLRVSRRVPHTGMAVITDWGHETDIHVKQKRPVGERLARIARALVYGEALIYSGPSYDGLEIVGNEVRVTFKHVGGGLSARQMVLEDVVKDFRTGETGGALHVAVEEKSAGAIPLQGFAVAGEDRKFYPAEAEIRGEIVVVSSARVEKPVAVRYGWADYPTGNLFNSEGLPASPFRTDDWPMAAETAR